MNGNLFPEDVYIKNFEDGEFYLNKNDLIQKIKTAFNYQEPFDIKIDFWPLFTQSTLENSYFLYHRETLIGSILVKNKVLLKEHKEISTCCLGGIFIDEKFQGKGFFKIFFNAVLNKLKQKDYKLAILWSENEKLYKKFGFLPVGETYWHNPVAKTCAPIEGFELTSFDKLSEPEFSQIKDIHRKTFANNTFTRNHQDWEEIKKITSIKIFIKRNQANEIQEYYFQGKGMDLTGIIHESNSIDIKEQSFLSPNKPMHQNYSKLPSALVRNLKEENINLSCFFALGADCI